MSASPPFDFQAFVKGYVTCMLWSSNDESDSGGGEPIDSNYSASDIPVEDMKAIEADCRRFSRAQTVHLNQALKFSNYTSEQAGHDFWLTREGHGAGFWDREELKTAHVDKVLTEAAHAFGSHVEGGPWVEDGKVHYGRSKDEEEARVAAADPRRGPAIEAVKAVLPAALGEAMDCTRVWSAWSYGTMNDEDFSLVSDDDDRIQEIAEAVVDGLRQVKDPVTDEKIREAINDGLWGGLGNAYDCTASWDAWADRSMRPDDFRLVVETNEHMEKLSVAIEAAIRPQFAPKPTPEATSTQSEHRRPRLR